MSQLTKFVTISLVIISLYCLNTQRASAHPGELDAQGCHYCRKNCREYNLKPNQYHCHADNNMDKVLGIADQANSKANPDSLSQGKNTALILVTCAAAYVGYKLFATKPWYQ